MPPMPLMESSFDVAPYHLKIYQWLTREGFVPMGGIPRHHGGGSPLAGIEYLAPKLVQSTVSYCFNSNGLRRFGPNTEQSRGVSIKYLHRLDRQRIKNIWYTSKRRKGGHLRRTSEAELR
jgi:hypothetical protein